MNLLCPVLFAALLLSPTLSFAWCDNCPGDCCRCPGEAQCLGSYATCEEACSGGRGGSSSRSYQEDPAVRAARIEAARRQAIIHTNSAGVEHANRGDWVNALPLFQYALDSDPNNATYQDNVKKAHEAIASQKRQAEIQRARDAANAAEVQKMGDVMGSLIFDGGAPPPPPGTGGLDFMAAIPSTGAAGGSGVQLSYPPHGDPRIVDARNLPPAVTKDIDRAIKRAYPKASPEVTERLKKAFTAVENRDWKVAKGWFQDALKRDPTNVGLQRFVILTQDPDDLKKVPAPPAPPLPLVRPINPPPGPKAPNDDIIRFFKNFRDGVAQNPKPEVREFVLSLSPDSFKYLLSVQVPENRDLDHLFTTNPSAALQLPLDEDIAFLFDPPEAKAPQLKPQGKN